MVSPETQFASPATKMTEQMYPAELYNDNFSKLWAKGDAFESLHFMQSNETMRELESPSSSDGDGSGSELSDLSEYSDEDPIDAHTALAR